MILESLHSRLDSLVSSLRRFMENFYAHYNVKTLAVFLLVAVSSICLVGLKRFAIVEAIFYFLAWLRIRFGRRNNLAVHIFAVLLYVYAIYAVYLYWGHPLYACLYKLYDAGFSAFLCYMAGPKQALASYRACE
ncbi:hypothetical protein HELRODRAFT_184385 [Helobdella robusta]|uniref:Uncharacterized protein n=1 Tax=Helobdella robusta TaxID=6412 RepID=T1FL37_HELRO|nr:hypothetical protein HELRODRAFT_184385 [Helobdella robusta]ESN99676.1 hypothetical protein HELRODRAFT_184385 [Helobdella robusta]